MMIPYTYTSFLRQIFHFSPNFIFFFFNDTATTEIYTLSLHDALPISSNASPSARRYDRLLLLLSQMIANSRPVSLSVRSEEHTSELQSLAYLVCRLLLEKKKKKMTTKGIQTSTDTSEY